MSMADLETIGNTVAEALHDRDSGGAAVPACVLPDGISLHEEWPEGLWRFLPNALTEAEMRGHLSLAMATGYWECGS